MSRVEYGEISWERMIRAIEQVRERLARSTAALEQTGVLYAVAGGNAVSAWVSRIDEAAVRNTQDVDILLRRENLSEVTSALRRAGFLHRHVAGSDLFLDGPTGTTRSALKIHFAGERHRASQLLPAPDPSESTILGSVRVLDLNPLVRFLLATFLNEDGMLIRDLIDVGLVDAAWPARLPADLAARLQELLDTPEG